MRLTELMTGMLAKASRASFGKHTGSGLFGEFEQRKEHLHEEVKVDKRGRLSKRWVKNNPDAPSKPRSKKQSTAEKLGMYPDQGNMPALFAPPAPQAKPKTSRKTKTPKPAPEAPLFGFDFSAVKPPPPIKLDAPLKSTVAAAEHAAANWHNVDEPAKWRDRLQKILDGEYRLTHGGASTLIPGDSALQQSAKYVQKDFARELLKRLPAEDKPATPKPASPAPATLTTAPAADSSLTLTQEEHRAWEAGALLIGSTKNENGRTYRLNANHRWERADPDPENPASAAATPEPDPSTPRVTQAEFDQNPDSYGIDMDTGQPTGLRWEDGRGTVLGPVHIEDRTRPTSIRAASGHVALRPSNRQGVLRVDGIKGMRAEQDADGQWWMHTGPGATPVHLTEESPGVLAVTKRRPAAEPGTTLTPDAESPVQATPATASAPQARMAGVDYTQTATPDWFSTLPKFGFELLSKSTPARRIAANQEAIALSERLTEEGRTPTPDERAILARYTGDGGTNGDLNAHYTPTHLAGAMWRLLHRAGFSEGTVLEPSMGAGVFFETAPFRAQMHGVELSPVTQKVSALLHAGDTVNDPQPFERYHTNNPEVTFAASISNPPYGSRGQVYGELDKPEIHEAERYFMDTVLDKLEDGGLSVSLTNPGPFESADGRAFRARLAARADVLGVYQLPQSVFGDSESGVPPVILVMRKRPHAVGMTLAKMVEQHGEEVLDKAGILNPAFAEGTLHLQPENLFGTFTGKTLFRGYKDIQGATDAALLSRVAEANLKDPANITPEHLDATLGGHYGMQELDKARTRAAAYGVATEGEINGDRIYSQGRWRTLSDAAPELSDATAISRILQQLAHVKNNGQNGDAEMVRQDAHARVQDFLAAHGNPHDMKSVRDAAKHHHLLANLLTAVTRDGSIARHLTTPLRDEDTGADLVDRTDLGAVATHLHARGRLTPEHVSRLWEGANGDRQTAEQAMMQHPDLALTEDGRFVPADTYYHGNVFDRAASLDAQAEREDRPEYKTKYQEQAERFRTMLPRTPLEDIEVTPRDKWLPPQVVEDYINEVVDPGMQVSVTQHAGVFYVHGPGTPALDEMRKYLNYAQTPDSVRGQKDKSKEAIAAERAANLTALQDRIKHIEGSFAGWLSGHEHRETAEDAYNRNFNAHIPETLSTEPLDAEKNGWTGPKLHNFQRQDVRFMLQQGGGITALDVGLGKTYTGAALLDELQRTGKAKKPMVVVPRSLLPNWRQTFGKAHEDANIISHPDEDAQHGRRVLIIGQTYKGKKLNKKTGEMEDHWTDDSGDEVAQKLVRAAHENWHAVVITRDWHSRIPLRPETWGRMVETDVQKQRNIELDEADDTDRASTGKRKGNRATSIRDAEQKKAEALVKAARKLFKNHANPLHWEDLGVDALLCDEAHCFPAGTLVDGRPIESYQAGDMVSAYDHASGQVVQARILNVQRTALRQDDRLYRVTLHDGQQVVSTGSHPYFTQDGYVFARDLRAGDTVYRTPTGTAPDTLRHAESEAPSAPASGTDASLPPVRATLSTREGAGLEEAHERRDGVLLLEVLPGEARASAQRGIPGGDQGRECAPGGRTASANGEHAGTRQDAGSQGEDARDPESQGAPAQNAGRERPGHDPRTGRGVDGSLEADRRGVDTGVIHQDRAEAGQRVSGCVQGGSGLPAPDGRRGVGRLIALIAFPAGPRPEEGRALAVARVDRIEMVEQSSAFGPGSVCESGFVYNLEVEAHHNYFAEGVLVHNCYKNLYAAPPALGSESPKYMGAGGESKRAQDFNYKARHLRERNGGHGIYFLTATPTKNSPLEVFNMLSHITDGLSKRGIGLTDDFVNRYCKIESRSVPALDGTYESKPCVVGFKNLGELRGLMSQHVFRRTKDSEDVKALPGWHVPERDDIEHEFEMEPGVAGAYQQLAESAKAASHTMGGFDETGRHVFSYLADMRKMTLDPGLLGHDTGQNPRFQKAAEIAMNAEREGGKTVMFMDLGKQREVNDEGDDSRTDAEINDAAVEYGITDPNMKPADRKKAVIAHENSMQQNAYDRLVEHLVKQGIPRDRIAVVTGETAKNTQVRQDIKDQFNAGKLSVVIGSTQVIGEGFSLQRGTTDMVHLDTPWDPGTYQQRLGRAQRQGNTLATVRNHVLLAKNSFDAVTYSTMLGKQGWMQQLWDGNEDAADNAEASSSNLEDIAAMLDSDPAKYKELAEQRKREAVERAEVAAQQLVVERVRKYARQVNAVHQNERDYAKMERDVSMLERQLPTAPATKVDAIREGIARKRGQLVKAAARKDKIAREARSAGRMLLEDPRLQDQHREAITSGQPFLMDAQGGCYAAGGVFTDGQGRQRRIKSIDTQAAMVDHVPLVPSHMPNHWQDKPAPEAVSTIEGATGHEFQRSDETERAMLTHVLNKSKSLAALRRIHPDLVSKHAAFIQAHLREHAADLRNSYAGVWSVGPDDKAHYTPGADGARNTLTPLRLPEGHRYLLNSHEDRTRLEAAMRRPDMPYTATTDAPSNNEGEYDRISRVTTYKVSPAAQHTGTHIVKADQGTPTFVDLFASLQARKHVKMTT
ncbi:hypothetical protein IHN59_00240 [Deinococcus sp. 23YEL01]|nr:SNF2-related protein [Deinococcus sp. 23YEL01]MCD0168053.1 hypothetical protein [Deinococcus sp. 23YEL01]